MDYLGIWAQPSLSKNEEKLYCGATSYNEQVRITLQSRLSSFHDLISTSSCRPIVHVEAMIMQ